MRFTAEQAAALQARMIDAHEAKVKAWAEQKINTRLENLQQAKLARQAMIDEWTGKVSPELLQLVASEEWIVDFEFGREIIDACLDETFDTPLVLEYEGEALEICTNGDCFDLNRLATESRIGVPETLAAAEQEVWQYFGNHLLDQAAAERKAQAEEDALEENISKVVDVVVGELEKAMCKHGPINSQHEAYSVILEELGEFWEEVRKAQNSKVVSVEARKELVQIAAMAIRTLIDLKAFGRTY